jgi:outer membrane protein OmpA-like peptidoglycan-associated protein
MRSLFGTLTALVVSGCASVAPPAPPAAPPVAPAPGPAAASAPAAPTVAEQKTAAASALAVERQWLAAWFSKTPVVIGQRSDGAVTIDVPRAFCFDPGRSAVKPALAAVLDKLAESMRRVPAAQLPLLAAPDDDGGAAKLALQRAAEMREHLRARGVAVARLGKPAVTTAAAVQLRMEPAPPP